MKGRYRHIDQVGSAEDWLRPAQQRAGGFGREREALTAAGVTGDRIYLDVGAAFTDRGQL